MIQTISFALFAGGIALSICGSAAADSLGSDASRFLTGLPTDKSLGLLIGGMVATAIGAGELLRGSVPL